MSTVQEIEAAIPKLSKAELSKLKEMVDAVLESKSSSAPIPAQTCAELAKRWATVERLPDEDGIVFADDIQRARKTVPPVKSKWE